MADRDNALVGWCNEHDEPAKRWEDGSWGCWWELVVETNEHGASDLTKFDPGRLMDRKAIDRGRFKALLGLSSHGLAGDEYADAVLDDLLGLTV